MEIPLFALVQNREIPFHYLVHETQILFLDVLDFAGLVNADLAPGNPIELEITQPYDCEIISSIKELKHGQVQIYPNLAQDHLIIETLQALDIQVSVFNSKR